MCKLELFLHDVRAHGGAESTITEYRRRLTRTDEALQALGKSLETATAPDFRDLIQRMSRDGLASNTVGAAARTFRVFVKRTGGSDWQTIEGPSDKRTIYDCPNEKEMESLLAAAGQPTRYGGRARYATNHVRNTALLAVAYSTGCRVSELVKLQVDDFMVAAGRVRFKRVKGGGEHIGFITNEAFVLVGAWLKTLPQPLKRDAWVFPSPLRPGEPISVDTVAELIDCCQRTTHYRGRATPHAFRRAMITHTLQRLKAGGNGAALAHVAGMVGHTSWKTTERYVCYTDQAVKEAHKRFPKRDEHGRLYYTSPDESAVPSLDFTTLGLSVQ